MKAVGAVELQQDGDNHRFEGHCTAGGMILVAISLTLKKLETQKQMGLQVRDWLQLR